MEQHAMSYKQSKLALFEYEKKGIKSSYKTLSTLKEGINLTI